MALYDALMVVRPSAIAALNRAVALEHVLGTEPALEALRAANADGRFREGEYMNPRAAASGPGV